MTRASDPPVDGDPRDASLDAELGRILEAYLADLEAGRPVDPERLLAEHPSLAEPAAVVPGRGEPGRSRGRRLRLARAVPDGVGRRDPARRGFPLGAERADDPRTSAATQAPRVHLRDLPDDAEPLVRPRSAAMPRCPRGAWGRYQLQGEIARGGMGAILKGRDVDLGRDLAIKVLLESHQGNPEVVRRFIEEAQIGGQLQHPGIVPVYELGTFPDRRPYFAMKLVKGRTLAATAPGSAPIPGTTSLGSCRSSSRSARRWPMPTPAA